MKLDYPRRARQGWTRFIPSWTVVLGSALTVGLVAVVSMVIVFAVTWSRLDVPQESEIATAQTSIVYWNDAETEMARLGDANRISVPLTDVPLDAQHAVLAAEDRSFYEHGGFAVKGFLRAAWANLTAGQSQGGSTITQQYTKNAFLSSEKTYARKLDELVLSMKLENQLDKDQILERYLNTIYFGRGAYGIETAAETYFGTQAKDLTREQSAVLAAIINAPGLYSPDTHRDRLEARYGYVLDGMVAQGWLTPQERDEALGSFPEILMRRTGPDVRRTERVPAGRSQAGGPGQGVHRGPGGRRRPSHREHLRQAGPEGGRGSREAGRPHHGSQATADRAGLRDPRVR